jgi:hypothetical protein
VWTWDTDRYTQIIAGMVQVPSPDRTEPAKIWLMRIRFPEMKFPRKVGTVQINQALELFSRDETTSREREVVQCHTARLESISLILLVSREISQGYLAFDQMQSGSNSIISLDGTNTNPKNVTTHIFHCSLEGSINNASPLIALSSAVSATPLVVG